MNQQGIDKPTCEELENRIRELERQLEENQRTTEVLRRSEEKHRSIFENIEDEYYEVDLKGDFTFLNQAACKNQGLSREEMIGQNFRNFTTPEEAERLYQVFLDVYQTGVPAKLITRDAIRKDETVTSFEDSVSLLRNSEGEPIGFSAIGRNVTEKKKYEMALRQSEESYRNVLELAPDAIAISRIEDGLYLQVNEAFCRMTGYKAEEVLDRTVFELNLYIDPADRNRLLEPLRRQGGVGGLEFQFRAKDGTPLNTLISARIIRFQDEECLLVVVTNINSFKKTQQALQASEERYRHILESIEEGYYEVDLAGNFTFVNETLRRSMGYSDEELMGMNYWTYRPPEVAKRIYAIFNEIYRTASHSRLIEDEVIRKDGSRRIIEMSVSLLRNTSGESIGFYGMSRDVTERKKTEKALQESEEKYRLLVENAHEGIFIIQDKVVIFSNPRMAKLTGYSVEELARLSFLSLVHLKDQEAVKKREGTKPESEGPPDTYSFRMITKEKETLWVELNTIRIIWEGRPATLNFLRDVTAQKKMEAQFLQAQKMEAVGTLAGGIAHDFNNLLMGIQGNASLILLDMEPHHPHYDKLRGIEQLVKGGAELTKQLLGIARRGKYEIIPTDINTLIDKSSDLFGRTRKEIGIHKQLQEDIWVVEVDRSQIEQVLLNLYVNAWQAMTKGGNLFLETRNMVLDDYYVKPYGVAPGRFVRISVTDTGIGMDEETRKRVFDPFFTTKEMGRGTGLGLASAYGIIKNHKGLINVYSEKGEGTTFTIYLPVSEKRVKEERNSREEIVKGTGLILFADDEEPITKIGQLLLERLGYHVIIARSGSEVIEVYRREGDRIDLVILDMIMPGLNGGDTFYRLKEIDPKVKVLLSSGYSINGQAKSILDRGCKGFIQKPFNVADLSRRVRQIMDEGR